MEYNEIFKGEDELRRNFYLSYLPRVDKTLSLKNVLTDYSDGVVKGNIIEFKKNANDNNHHLFQVIKYLSIRRIKGKPIPANIIIISIISKKAYLYHSEDYLSSIEKIYSGAPSRNNAGFVAQLPIREIDYSTELGENDLITVLRTCNYTRINLDENCIVGWAKSYYEQKPNARKGDFLGDRKSKIKILGEIRKPVIFKDYINPYKDDGNERFRYLMDKLNDKFLQKNLGAFYTHPIYAKKALELVRQAIARVPEGNDYVIIDRCAGTGNLEQFMTEEELSHCIVSTLEYYEYKVLFELIGDKATIIPPTEKEDTFNVGLVKGSDALQEDYINNPIIKKYVDNPNCTIILFENPPYSESTSAEHQRQDASKKSSEWKKSYVVNELKKEKFRGKPYNDIGNAFIWSAFKYYLRQPTDSYIVFSPVKYWKVQHLVNKKMVKAFAFNRKHFHRNIGATIMCALWYNIEDETTKKFKIRAFDIIKDKLVKGNELPVEKVFSTFSEHYYDKRKYPKDQRIGVCCGLDGLEKTKGVTARPLTNDNVIGYLVAHSSGFDNPDLDSSLLVASRYDGHGFFLNKDNYLQKLPMFAASRFYKYNREWTLRGRIMKSGDGYRKFHHAVKSGEINQFLLKCLLFTVLEPQNHMRCFKGSNGKFYTNQLCLDASNGETIAIRDLKLLNKNEKENELLSIWDTILKFVKQTSSYNPRMTYGVHQIEKEINTFHRDENNKRHPDHPELNGALKSLNEHLKCYYITEILPVLYRYKFLM